MSDFKESTEYQQKTWDDIAEMWHQYRQRPMHEVVEFLKPLRNNRNARVLDLCCGSGRHFMKIAGELYAVDFSKEMLRFAQADAKKKGIKVVLKHAYAHDLPFDNNFFDAVIFTASLSSIETKYRGKALQEIMRVLKPGGRVLITVWNRWQPRFFFKRKRAYVPWKKNGKRHLRYYYLFTKKELKQVVEDNGFAVDSVEGSKNKAFKKFSQNIVLLAHKPEQ